MTPDLFEHDATWEALRIPDATVRYLPSLRLPVPSSALLEALVDDTPWRSETVRLFGKAHRQPRLVAWYADDGLSYAYSGSRLEAMPFTDRLDRVRSAVEGACGRLTSAPTPGRPWRRRPPLRRACTGPRRPIRWAL